MGVEQALLREPRQLKLMVHIGGQHKEVLAVQQLKQLFVGVLGRLHVAVVPYVAAPVGPLLLQRWEGEEAGRVHVGEPARLDEVGEVAPESLPAVGEPGCRRKSRSGAHHHGFCRMDDLDELFYVVVGVTHLHLDSSNS